MNILTVESPVITQTENEEEKMYSTSVMMLFHIIEGLLPTTHLEFLCACPTLMSLVCTSCQSKTHLQGVMPRLVKSQTQRNGDMEKCQPGLYF